MIGPNPSRKSVPWVSMVSGSTAELTTIRASERCTSGALRSALGVSRRRCEPSVRRRSTGNTFHSHRHADRYTSKFYHGYLTSDHYLSQEYG